MRKIPVSTVDMYAVYEQGYSCADVASRFGLKTVTVKARFYREGYKLRCFVTERTNRWYQKVAAKKQTSVRMTVRERLVFNQFLKRGVRLVPQYAVFRYNIDLAHPDKRLAIELDGRHHDTPVVAKRDKKKAEFLTKRGWTVVRLDGRRKNGRIIDAVIDDVCRKFGLP